MDKFDCCDTVGVNGSHIKPWMEKVLRKWHDADPVSDLEKQFNDAVFGIQANRSPFIDNPDWVKKYQSFKKYTQKYEGKRNTSKICIYIEREREDVVERDRV